VKWTQEDRRGPMLMLSELTAPEKELVQKDLLRDARVKRIDFTGDGDEQLFDQLYLEVLHSWGIACPHPTSSLVKTERALKCTMCGCGIIVPGMAKLAKKTNAE
jgi:hypothetical protein